MGVFDKVKGMANKNKTKIADGVDKATDAADGKTGGKHHDNLQKLDDAADRAASQSKDTSGDS